ASREGLVLPTGSLPVCAGGRSGDRLRSWPDVPRPARRLGAGVVRGFCRPSLPPAVRRIQRGFRLSRCRPAGQGNDAHGNFRRGGIVAAGLVVRLSVPPPVTRIVNQRFGGFATI